ncbi:MAG: hypothetical protein ACI9QA_000569, partial [Methanobacteriota archaeon]
GDDTEGRRYHARPRIRLPHLDILRRSFVKKDDE